MEAVLKCFLFVFLELQKTSNSAGGGGDGGRERIPRVRGELLIKTLHLVCFF